MSLRDSSVSITARVYPFPHLFVFVHIYSFSNQLISVHVGSCIFISDSIPSCPFLIISHLYCTSPCSSISFRVKSIPNLSCPFPIYPVRFGTFPTRLSLLSSFQFHIYPIISLLRNSHPIRLRSIPFLMLSSPVLSTRFLVFTRHVCSSPHSIPSSNL